MNPSTRLMLCPECQHSFPMPAGTVTACPRCGKVVLIPSQETAPAPPAIPPEFQSTLPVICKLCNSRYYAKPVEMGKILKCPDCHTGNMVVPMVDKKMLGGLPASSVPEATPVASTHDEYELKLSDPVEVPKYRALTPEAEHLEAYLNEMHRKAGGNPSPTNTAVPNLVPLASNSTPPATPSLANAYAEDSFSGVGVGARVNSPYPNVPPPPKPTTRSWKESEDNSTATRETGGKQTVVETRATPPSPRETAPTSEVEIPAQPRSNTIGWDKRYPFTSGIIEIFRQGQVLSRWFTVALLVSAQIFMLTIVDKKSLSEDASELVSALFIMVVFVFSVIPTVMAMSSFTLAIFEDTANGENVISSWPEFSLIELFQGSLYILGSLTLTGIPGLIVGLALYDYIFYDDSEYSYLFTAAVGSLFVLLSCFLFFPIVFTSMLETGSVGEPISTTILKSFRAMYARWMGFYTISFLLTLVLLGTIFLMVALLPYLGILIIVPAAGVITSCPIIYMRLLGRLAMLYRDYLANHDEHEEIVQTS